MANQALRNHEESIAEFIRGLENKKQTLLREVECIDMELRRQKAQLARLVNEKIGVNRLPNEVLASIFAILQHSSHPIEPTITMSHVSTRWRDVVLSTSLLWNELILHVRPTSHTRGTSLARLQAHLERSSSCYLDITLTVSTNDSNPYLKLICTHSGRWRRVSLLLKHAQVTDVYKEFLMLDTPILEHLSLHIGSATDATSSPRVAYTTVAPQILKRGAPKLVFVRLAGHALGNLHASYVNVSTMHLDGWTRHYMTWIQFKTILESLPMLLNLSLNQVYLRHRRDPLDFPMPTSMLKLRCLRIRGPCTPVDRFFSLIHMPNLDCLSLQQLDLFDSDQVPSLKTLSLESCAFEDRQITNLLNAFPAVESLCVDDSVPVIYQMLCPDQDDSPDLGDLGIAWPHLRTIALRELQFLDVPNFCAMIFCRTSQNKTIQKVVLDRRSRTVLRTKHRLDWLTGRLNVENYDSVEQWPPGLGYDDPHDLEE